MIDPEGVQSELRRTRARLEVAEKDRDQLRRQLADTQKMFHLAAREKQELFGILMALCQNRDAETQEDSDERGDHPALYQPHL
jgi:hypothetical protein